jgi:hypothetical protein
MVFMAELQKSVFCKRKICVWGCLVYKTLCIIEIILTYYKLRSILCGGGLKFGKRELAE